jgi:uncharacterized protein
MLFISKYLHIVENGSSDISLLYHSINQKKFFVDKKFANFLKDHPRYKPLSIRDVDKKLTSSHMLVSSSHEDEAVREEYIRRLDAGLPKLGLLYLFPSTSCNLNCSYCSVHGGSNKIDGRTNFMTPENARRYVRWFLNVIHPSVKSPKMILYGGEPLLAKNALFAAIEEWNSAVKRKIPAARISIVTNGTLLDDEMIAFFKTHQVNVGLSLDGPSELHDASRPYSDGQKSFSDSFNAFKKLQKAGLNPGISSTLYGSNLENIDKTVEWISTSAKPKGMGFNIVHCRNDLNLSDKYFEQADTAIYRAFRQLREVGIYEDRAMRRVNAFVEPKFHLIDCAALGRQLAIDPDGNVGVCHIALGNGDNIIGNVDDLEPTQFLENDKHLSRWAQYAPILDDNCQKCPGLALCGGGCKYHVDNFGQPTTRISRDIHFCESIIRWFERLTHELLEVTVHNENMP